MNSYHSLFLSDDGDVYATGHGKGGRLGTADELTLVTPRKISIPLRETMEKIVWVSVGKNHSVVLSNKNRVYVTGSNVDAQLGLKLQNCENVLAFTEIPMNFSEAKKVVATDFGTFVVTSTDVWAFGKNMGNLGLKKEIDKLQTPRKLQFNRNKDEIDIFECNNHASVCYTDQKTNLLHILYKHTAKVYKKPLMERITAISVNGGGSSMDFKSFRFIVLTELHNIFIYFESCEKFVRCTIEASRFLEIDKIIWCNEDVLVSFFGNLYRGSTQELQLKASQTSASEYQETYIKKELSAETRIKIKLTRIPYTDKVVDFCCDPEGENFAVLLENPRKYFSLPDLIEKPYNFSNLYAEMNAYDNVHDVIFEICGRKFVAHKIIIFARCEYLKKQICQTASKCVALHELQQLGLTADLFELILRFLYTNNPIMKYEIERLTGDYHQTLTMLKKVLTLMGLLDLITSLKK